MAGVTVTVGGTTLPGGITAIKRSDELLWSEGTGRATNGQMVGYIVAQKQTYTIEWGLLSSTDYATVLSVANGGFVNATITVNGSQLASISVYRGTTTGELLQTIGNKTYYKSVTLELVER